MAARRRNSPLIVAFGGFAALAVAMGIGRFAFTPILPMMQADYGISVAQGGWLASANYLGYLAGSIFAMHPRIAARTATRIGLVSIAACTLAMGIEHHFAAWLVLRAIPGFASALVLVVVSAWVLPRLAHAAREHLSGIVYAGVGAGIMFAGLACLILVRTGASSDTAWIALGVTGVAVTIAVWRVLGEEGASESERASAALPHDTISNWRLVFCYGAFGLGYIIPATFLPVMAKQVIADAGRFAWAWPLFGGAAMISTVLGARLARRFGDRNVWIAGNVAMAIGILVPIALPNLAGILIAALCVGGTFMVNTMTGIHEARRVAGVHARALIGAMTSAFAVGQIIGPLLVAGLVHVTGGFSWALGASALPLLVAAYMLYTRYERSAGIVDATVARPD
jgi:predicted MFS family arabinose efflux permease